MPANDRIMVVVAEWVAKSENNHVVANCDLKQEVRRWAPPIALELTKTSAGLPKDVPGTSL